MREVEKDMKKSISRKTILKEASVLIIASVMVLSTIIVTGNMNVSENKYNEECGCCSNGGIDITVGECDNFTLPTEPTFLSQALWNWIDVNYQGTNDTRDCDETGNDKYWGNTFNLTGVCNHSIIGATLRITVKNMDTLFDNDDMAIGCIENNSSPWDYGLHIHDYIPLGQSGTIVIDLTDHPNAFSDMVNHSYLDVVVEDDSAIDCAILTIYCCECQLEVNIKPGFYIRTGTIPVIIQNVGTTECDNISYNITIKSIFGKVSGSSIGYTTLSPGEETTVNCEVIGKFGIVRITVEVEACGHTYTDNAFGIVFGPFILVL